MLPNKAHQGSADPTTSSKIEVSHRSSNHQKASLHQNDHHDARQPTATPFRTLWQNTYMLDTFSYGGLYANFKDTTGGTSPLNRRPPTTRHKSQLIVPTCSSWPPCTNEDTHTSTHQLGQPPQLSSCHYCAAEAKHHHWQPSHHHS